MAKRRRQHAKPAPLPRGGTPLSGESSNPGKSPPQPQAKPGDGPSPAPAAQSRKRPDMTIRVIRGLAAIDRPGHDALVAIAAGRGGALGNGSTPLGRKWGGGTTPQGGGSVPRGGSTPWGQPVYATGLHPDLPDGRDADPTSFLTNLEATRKRIRAAGKAAGQGDEPRMVRPGLLARLGPPPPKFDLRTSQNHLKGMDWPVRQQGPLSSCTAHAVMALVEYLMLTAGHRQPEALSRLFLYKASRRLLSWTGDTGAYLRTTIKALRVFGVPPEDYWPYDISYFDCEPEAFLYSYAQNYRAVSYFRLDPYRNERPGGGKGDDPANLPTLGRVKETLRRGLPVAFGFPIYSSVSTDRADIPVPGKDDSVVAGHAVVAVGYDDNHRVLDRDSLQPGGKGALIFRNSWGPEWGDGGYGYLPYFYVDNQLAVDFWAVTEQNWLENQEPFRV